MWVDIIYFMGSIIEFAQRLGGASLLSSRRRMQANGLFVGPDSISEI